jgi:large subunit ribosomal protein L35Ae
VYFRRGLSTQTEQSAILKVQNCNDRKASTFYHGKRVAFIFKSKNVKRDTSYKAMWGKIYCSHGNNGLVRARFDRNLPPRSLGSTLRVMLYPNKSI